VCELLSPPENTLHSVETLVFRNSAELFDRLNRLSAAEAAEAMVIYDASTDRHRLWDVAGIGLHDRGIGARLVLEFPEIYFIFFEASGTLPQGEIVWHHSADYGQTPHIVELLHLHSNGFRTLYDPVGLRSWLKENLSAVDPTRSENRFRTLFRARSASAALVIEDEPSFAHFNAFAAYKAGMRAFLVVSYREFLRLLPDLSVRVSAAQPKAGTVISDWDIQFVDQVTGSADPPLDLLVRLETIARVWFVTSNKRAAERGLLANIPRIGDGAAEFAKAADHRCVAKPYPGIFFLADLLAESPRSSVERTEPSEGRRHTAPHGCAMIAMALIDRAREFSIEETDHRRYLHQAMLAGEAKEILGGLSAATYLEALTLQNNAEIRAESSFPGTESNIQPSRRLDVFVQEVDYVESRHAGQEEWRRARLLYLSQQLNSFRSMYNHYEEVDAAETCFRKIAVLQRDLMSIGDNAVGRRNFWAKCRSIGLAYSDTLTSAGTSVSRLLAADCCIVGAFTIFFWLWIVAAHATSTHPWAMSGTHAAFSFLELQSGLGEYETLVDNANKAGSALLVAVYRFLLFFEIALAFINQGLLISVLYRRVTRRVP
jgi:hypothetical protein